MMELVSLTQAVQLQGTFDLETYNSGQYGCNPNRTFHSSDIVAPVFGINIWNAAKLQENSYPYLFITATEPGSFAMPYIFNATDLSLVWAESNGAREAVMNFKPEEYNGSDYLAFWEGRKVGGIGYGACVLFDQNYETSHYIRTRDLGIGADLHECKLTKNGTALLSAYSKVAWDLTAVGGRKRDVLIDCYFQEVDIATGNLLFSWRATDWFPPTDSYQPYQSGYDYFHLNSVEKVRCLSIINRVRCFAKFVLYQDRNGNYLISSRHTHTIALIAGKAHKTPGAPLWILNGKQNQFTDASNGKALDFSWQHHARFRNDDGTELTLFDNHHPSNYPGFTGCTSECSSAKRLRIDLETMTVSLMASYAHPQSLQSGSMGNVQTLDGNVVVGWGSNPSISEYTIDGECIMDIQFGPYAPGYTFGETVSSYRAFKGDWLGMPLTDPSISVDWSSKQVYVSWNGATEVRSWAVVS